MSYYPTKPKPVTLEETLQEGYNRKLAAIFNEEMEQRQPVSATLPQDAPESALEAF